MITQSIFTSSNGSECLMFTIRNKNGFEIRAIEYGAIIQSIKTPDRTGMFANIVLHYDNLDQYHQDNLHIGAIAGRYANRIANGSFSIDGKNFQVAKNDRGNHLHGGLRGFNKATWKGETISDNEVKFTYVSKDGEEGYPGELKSEVTYSLTDNNEWKVDIKATSSKPTVLNLVQHSYFNLTGVKDKSILDHELTICADSFLPVSDTMIPTGEYRAVENTPFDFRKSAVIRSQASMKNHQLSLGEGFDHCWILNESPDILKPAATLYAAASGRCMEVFTTKPGMHIYTGNFLTGQFKAHDGICMETQYFPDSPNNHKFPSPVLRLGEIYHQITTFKFSVR